MKFFYTISSWIILLLLGLSANSYAQCSGHFTLEYPTGSGTSGTVTFNNGSGNVNISYCPSGTTGVIVKVASASPGTFTFSATGGTYSESHTFTQTEVNNNTPYTFTLPNSPTTSNFQLNSFISCNNTKNSAYTLTLAPTLTVSATVNGVTSTNPSICPGSQVTLNASGASSTSTYTLLANNAVVGTNTTGAFTVQPTVATTYTVKTNTATCGTSTVSQNITINTNTLAISTTATNVAPHGPVTLTANGGESGSSYVWYERTSSTGPPTLIAGQTTSTLTRNPPVTTVYTVSGKTAAGSCASTVSRTIAVNNTPLPVELVSFEATWVNKVASIAWTTASEKNSAYFAAERSFDGSTFHTVGVLAGAGTTSITTNYRFNDISLNTMAVPKVYYRLQQVDISGEVSYSPVRVLQVAAAGNSFQAAVFPNPYTNTAAVQFHSSGDDVVKLTLHNVLGQNIFTKLVTAEVGVQEVALPLPATLPFGVYYLTIHQVNQQQVVRINH